MKALRSLLVLAFIGLATGTASAQFANSSSSSASAGSSIWTTVNTDGYNRIYVSYLPSKLKVSDSDGNIKMKGSFEAGYLRGIGLTSNVPLYLEVGGALQYRSYSEEDYGYETKFNMLSLNIPVALTYRINVTDDFAVSPNFGFDFRVNVMGKEKVTEDGDELYDTDLFSDADWKRFQAGWHIGVGLDYRALHFGVQYGTDFNEIAEELKITNDNSTLNIYDDSVNFTHKYHDQ